MRMRELKLVACLAESHIKHTLATVTCIQGGAQCHLPTHQESETFPSGPSLCHLSYQDESFLGIGPSMGNSDAAPPCPRGRVLLRASPHETSAPGGRTGAHHWLVVVFQGHGDHIEADDEGDEDVQVVAGAHGVDEQPGGTVGGIVGQPLGLCQGWHRGVAQATEGGQGGHRTCGGRGRGERGSKGERCQSTQALGVRLRSLRPATGPQGKRVRCGGKWQREQDTDSLHPPQKCPWQGLWSARGEQGAPSSGSGSAFALCLDGDTWLALVSPCDSRWTRIGLRSPGQADAGQGAGPGHRAGPSVPSSSEGQRLVSDSGLGPAPGRISGEGRGGPGLGSPHP